MRWAARGDSAFSRELLAKPDFRSNDRLFGDLRESSLMSTQLEKGKKAVGLVTGFGRVPSPYFRGVSGEKEIFPLTQQFL